MSNFDEAMLNRLKQLGREVERLKVKESPGAWLDYTPSISYTNGDYPTSATVSFARYTRIGNIITFCVGITFVRGTATAWGTRISYPGNYVAANSGIAITCVSSITGSWITVPAFTDTSTIFVIHGDMTSDGSLLLNGTYEVA